MKADLNVLIFCALLALPLAAVAGQTADQETSTVHQPVHGMTMQNVKHVFGAPLKKIAAVGDPPITRWIYTDYVVYFENNIVLHTVSKDKPFHDAPPAPVTKIVSGDGA